MWFEVTMPLSFTVLSDGQQCLRTSALQQAIRQTVLQFILTPWKKVLLEKLTGRQLGKKFPAFYEA
jgi:hypothetical protein